MAVLLQLPLGFYLNSNSLNPISTEKRFMLEGWKKGRGRFSEWKSSCCARSHSSAALFFSFAEAEPRKIISKQRGVATHLALINVGPYGAEPAKQRGRRSLFSRTLHLCAGTCSFNDWVKNQEPRCLKNRAESNLWPNPDTYSVFSLVPLKAWDSIWLNPFRTRFLSRTPCYSISVFGGSGAPIANVKELNILLHKRVEATEHICYKWCATIYQRSLHR